MNESSQDIYVTEERGTGAENIAGKAEEAEMNCLSVVSPVNLPIDQGKGLLHQSSEVAAVPIFFK